MKKSTARTHETLNSELRFLIACCQSEPSQEDIDLINNYLSQITNHEFLITAASQHGILPLIYKSLKKILEHNSPSSSLSPERLTLNSAMLHELKVHYQSIARRNMLMTAELIKFNKWAHSHGMTLLPFKGPLFAQIAYGDITLRQFSDLDILVRREDFRALASMMHKNGYEPYFPIETFKEDKVMFEMNNDCPFYDTKRGISVEIHWDFFRKLALPTQKLKPWEKNIEISIQGHLFSTLSHETHLLYHSLHGSKHLWERLSWIIDIDRYIRAVPNLDWEKIIIMAKDLDALKMFLLGPALANRYFDTPLPESIQLLCDSTDFQPFFTFIEKEYNLQNPTPEDSLVKLRKIIALRDSFSTKAITLLEFLFRPGINERRTVVLPDNLFWLYWPLRPLGMGFRFLFCRLLKICIQTDSNH